jgi:hypothetical protein
VKFNIENETGNGKGKMTQAGEKHAENTRDEDSRRKTIQIVEKKRATQNKKRPGVSP